MRLHSICGKDFGLRSRLAADDLVLIASTFFIFETNKYKQLTCYLSGHSKVTFGYRLIGNITIR